MPLNNTECYMHTKHKTPQSMKSTARMLCLDTYTAHFYQEISYRFTYLIEGAVELNRGIPASNSNQLIVRVHYDAVEWTPNRHSHRKTHRPQHSNSTDVSTVELNQASSSPITIITTTKQSSCARSSDVITDILGTQHILPFSAVVGCQEWHPACKTHNIYCKGSLLEQNQGATGQSRYTWKWPITSVRVCCQQMSYRCHCLRKCSDRSNADPRCDGITVC